MGIVCVCVDGCIYCFDYEGKSLWKFEICVLIFCFFIFMGLDCYLFCFGYVVFGFYDNNVYCLFLCGEL